MLASRTRTLSKTRTLSLTMTLTGIGAVGLLAAVFVLAGCSKRAAEAPTRTASVTDEAEAQEKPLLEELAAPGASAASAGPAPSHRGKRKLAPRVNKKESKKDEPGDMGGGEQAEQSRSWFPETFLFKPLLVTDDRGEAEVEVRVPDRLTTWRVLALAHSRGGAQAGTVTSFLGTLPVYVEPVVPPVLRHGDAVRLPVNLVNTTSAPVTTGLKLSATGLRLAARLENVTIPASSSLVRFADVRADAPGTAMLLARLGGEDAVARTIEVVPRGRPVSQTRSGTLAAPRQLILTRAAGADASLSRVRLEVFPGALAILRSELAASVSRSDQITDDAYALLLAGRAPELLEALGDTLDKADLSALRDMTILATQRVMRRARVLDTTSATLLAEAALAHRDNPVLTRLGERAISQIAAKQAPDGSCGGETGWTLQRLLVSTADCARAAVGERQVAIRASGVFERNAQRITDPYTAAAVLASGAVVGELAQKLRKLVQGAIKAREDGAKVVVVPRGVVRADGVRPDAVEAAALAVLALEKSKDAQLADLGAAIVGGYSPARGWGDGRASLVCIKAVLRLFGDPVPDNITITLKREGEAVAQQKLSRSRLREVLVLEAAGADAESWEVVASPAVPGLGYSLTLTDRVPWEASRPTGGVELSVTPPAAPVVGKPAALAVRATAPGGRPFVVSLALPAGVQVDRGQLDRLVSAGTLTRYSVNDVLVQLNAAALAPAKVFSAEVRVIPTLAGTLHSGPASLQADRTKVFVPPTRWVVK